MQTTTKYDFSGFQGLLAVDWLSIGGLVEIEPTSDFTIMLQDKSTNIFKAWSKVYYRGRYFGDLLQNPASHIINPRTWNFKVANEFFYNANYILILEKFLGLHAFYEAKINRLDIAVDSDKNLFGFSREHYMNETSAGRWARLGKSKQTTYEAAGGEYRIDTVSIGKRSGGVTLTWYDKSKELKEVKAKPYISDVWKIAGFHVEQVSRIEVSLNFNAIQALQTDTGLLSKPTLLDIQKKDYLVSLWVASIKRKLDIRWVSLAANASRWHRVDLQLDNFDLNASIMNYQQSLSNDQSAHKSITSLLKVINSLNETGALNLFKSCTPFLDSIALLASKQQAHALVFKYIKSSDLAIQINNYLQTQIIEL